MTCTYLQNVRLLVVEDNLFCRRMTHEVLKIVGAEHFEFARNGLEAWDLMKRDVPDMVLLDWDMEGMNGFELLKKIRKDEKSPNQFLPIIMITGFGDRSHIFAARDADVNEYIVKPMSAKILIDRIQAVVERPRRFVRVANFFGPDRRRQNKIFVGPDKRGQAGPPPGAPKPPPDQDMNQGAINLLFNPDDAPLPPDAGDRAPAPETQASDGSVFAKE
ncbi:MAG: response regulator [Alphaproteobacteria bacterium]|nr:response regulator [Alphaproteobacteria bacterium]